MKLDTKRLIIRSLKLDNEKAYVEMASDGSLNDIFGDCSECYKWMAYWLKEAIQLDRENNPYKEYLAYAIIEKESNRLIGSIGCSYYKDLKEIGITYFIGGNYRRNGYASEAANAYARYFLENYNVSKIIATVRSENEASCKTIEKSDFKLKEIRMYKDINDEKEENYKFYEKRLYS